MRLYHDSRDFVWRCSTYLRLRCDLCPRYDRYFLKCSWMCGPLIPLIPVDSQHGSGLLALFVLRFCFTGLMPFLIQKHIKLIVVCLHLTSVLLYLQKTGSETFSSLHLFLCLKVSLNRSNSLCTDGCYDSLVQMHLPQIYSHQPTCWMWIILQLSSYLLVH